MKRLALKVAVLGCPVLIALVMAASADGATMNHASQCNLAVTKGTGGAAAVAPDLTFADVNGTQLVNTTAADKKVICPVQETRDPLALGTVAVDVWKSAADGVTAKGCHTFTFGGGGACTPGDPNTNTGVQHLTIPSSAWHSSHYNYLVVQLRPIMGGNANVLFGYSHTP